MLIIKNNNNNSCEIEDFVETHLRKLCVVPRSRELRVLVGLMQGRYTLHIIRGRQDLKLQNSRSVSVFVKELNHVPEVARMRPGV